MSLMDAAKEFLIESLDNYSRQKINFSIIHATTSIELLLKERLYRIHPNLIYKNIDCKNDRNTFTIELSGAPTRLINLGINLSREEVADIELFSKWRNTIVHHLPTHENKAAKVKLEQIYNFIINFLVNELNENFKLFLPKKYYVQMQTYIDALNQEITFAKQKAVDSGHVDYLNRCPICGLIGVVEIKDEDSGYCHLCLDNLRTSICSQCEKPFHGYSEYTSVIDEYCPDCVESAGELYFEHLIDLERGK